MSGGRWAIGAATVLLCAFGVGACGDIDSSVAAWCQLHADKVIGQPCSEQDDCCDPSQFSCEAGTSRCTRTQFAPDGGYCIGSGENGCVTQTDCCNPSDECNPEGTCRQPGGPACIGQVCREDAECCTGQCLQTDALTARCAEPDAVVQANATCLDQNDCAGALWCDQTLGISGLGRCKQTMTDTSSRQVGESCSVDSDCFSGQCLGDGGDRRCQPAEACHRTGESCEDQDPNDCCGVLQCGADRTCR